MGLFGDAVKVAKDVATGFGGKVLKVARDIKRVAGEVTTAIRKTGGGLISEAYGKVKSFGSMVLGKIFPSADTAEIESLQSVTSSAKQAGGTQFVQNFSGALNSAQTLGPVKPGTRTITQQIQDGFDYIGGNIQDATQRIYNNTLETLGAKPKAGTNVGEAIVKKSKIVTDVQRPATPVSGFITDNGIYDLTNNRGVSDLIGKPALPLKLDAQPLNVQYQNAIDAGMSKDVVEQSRKLGVSPYAGIVGEIKNKGLVGSGATQTDLIGAGFGMDKMVLPGDKSNIYSKPTLLNRAIDTAKSLSGKDVADAIGAGFGTFGDLNEEPFRTTGGITPSMNNANRGGVGGRGSAGGEFLSAAQRAFLNQQASQLERVG